MSSHNEALVARLGNIKPIEGADKIRSADVMVNGITIAPVVVGTEENDGQMIIYFDSNIAFLLLALSVSGLHDETSNNRNVPRSYVGIRLYQWGLVASLYN